MSECHLPFTNIIDTHLLSHIHTFNHTRTNIACNIVNSTFMKLGITECNCICIDALK